MVYSARLQCGRMLARESPIDADIVSSVPESGTAAAHGYARQVRVLEDKIREGGRRKPSEVQLL